jgi:DNA-binding transcriptional regulator LsrR (DeoR family)
MNISLEDHNLWVKVAKLYYEDDLTQSDIAERLGYSRVKIHRILQSAKEAGIIQVQIKSLKTNSTDLEHKLINKYALRDCIVVEEKPAGEDLYLALVSGAATWLKSRLRSNLRIGLGLGRTLSYLPHVFEIDKTINCTFTEVTGAVSDHSWGFESNNIASQMAEICGGRAELFYAPTIVSNSGLKDQLIKERSIKKSLERARNCDIVLQSVGPVDETAILFIHGYLSRTDLEQLQKDGAVGDALGCYFDKNGSIVPSPIDGRMVGIHLSELVDFPWSVLVAGGSEKVIPINASLNGKFFNVLITDSRTGSELLEEE